MYHTRSRGEVWCLTLSCESHFIMTSSVSAEWRAATTQAAQNRIVARIIKEEGVQAAYPAELDGAILAPELRKKLERHYKSAAYKKQVVTETLNRRCMEKDNKAVQSNKLPIDAIDAAVETWRKQLNDKGSVASRRQNTDKHTLIVYPYRFSDNCPLDMGRACIFDLSSPFHFYWTPEKGCAPRGYFTVDARGDPVYITNADPKALLPPKEHAELIDKYINYKIVKSKKRKLKE